MAELDPDDTHVAAGADRQALVGLSQRYAAAADDRDFAGLGSLFAHNGVLIPMPEVSREGPDAIAEAVTALGRYDATFHMLGQIRTWLDPTTGEARGETYCVAHHFSTGDDGATRDRIMYIRYQDTFANEDGQWRFARRELVVPRIIDAP